MKPRALLNLALLASVAGLGLALYLTREQPEPEVPLTALVEDDIRHIRLAHPGTDAIVLAREGSRWRLQEPVQGEADALEVNGILNVARLPVKRVVEAGANRTELGLEPPEFILQLNDETLGFGALEPLAFQRYIATANGVSLVDNPPSAALDADYSDLLSKRLFPEDRHLVALRLPGISVRQEGDQWISDSHPHIASDTWQRWLQGWHAAQALWNAKAGADSDTEVAETVSVTLDDGRGETLRILRREPQLEVVNPRLNVQYTLSRALVDTLLSPPEDSPSEPSDDATPGAPE